MSATNWEDAYRVQTDAIKELRAENAALRAENAELRGAAVEVCAVARVWATVWHDKLSNGSIQRFAELEKQILKEAQP